MSNVIPLHRRVPVVDLTQFERCGALIRKNRSAGDADLRQQVAECLRRMVAGTAGGLEAAAGQIETDPRTLQSWCRGTRLPRLADAVRVARRHPPLADLIGHAMGLPVDGLTAADAAALRQAFSAAGKALAKLDVGGQLALFG